MLKCMKVQENGWNVWNNTRKRTEETIGSGCRLIFRGILDV